MNDRKNEYEDILYLPHQISETHPRMSIADRAAQFSPFQALTGYGDVIRETARLTDARMELDEYRKAEINEMLLMLQEQSEQCPIITVTYFEPDEKKDGGAYVTAVGRVKKIKPDEREMVLEEGTIVPIDEIVSIISE